MIKWSRYQTVNQRIGDSRQMVTVPDCQSEDWGQWSSGHGTSLLIRGLGTVVTWSWYQIVNQRIGDSCHVVMVPDC